jgi:hypothetical protein
LIVSGFVDAGKCRRADLGGSATTVEVGDAILGYVG